MPIILPAGQGRQMVENRFSARQCRLNEIREVDTFCMIPQCVEIGLGDTILPSSWVSGLDENRMGRVLLDDDIMCRQLAICYPAARGLSLPALRIAKLVEEVSTDLIASRQWTSAKVLAASQSLS